MHCTIFIWWKVQLTSDTNCNSNLHLLKHQASNSNWVLHPLYFCHKFTLIPPLSLRTNFCLPSSHFVFRITQFCFLPIQWAIITDGRNHYNTICSELPDLRQQLQSKKINLREIIFHKLLMILNTHEHVHYL